MKTKTTLGLALLLTVGGCHFGDRIPETRTVSVTLAESGVHQHTNAPTIGGEFQDALEIIDTVLTSQGFVRDQEPVGASGQGLVASYARHQGPDQRLLGGPAIYIQADTLRIVFETEGGMNAHISQSTVSLTNLLRDKLAGRYGPEKVTIGQ